MSLKIKDIVLSGAFLLCLMLNSFGEDYETAPYTVIKADGIFEVRDYPDLKMVATGEEKKNDAKGDVSFWKLFDYISGKNETQQNIAMTTPVIMTEEADKEKMHFMLPKKVAESGAPKPVNQAVEIVTLPKRRVAVITYSGRSNETMEAEKSAELRRWMEKQKLTPVGKMMRAFYNDPMTPGPQRRNEVMWEIQLEKR